MIATVPSKTLEGPIGETRAAMARRLGVSERHVYRLLAAERDGAASEMPVVPITDGAARGHHYNLSHDQASDLPARPFLIGSSRGRLKVACSSDDMSRTRTDRPKSKAKFRPKAPRKNKPAKAG